MRFGKLEIDPARSPAVLDTATWDREAVVRQLLGDRARWSEPGAATAVDAACGAPAGNGLAAGGPVVRAAAERDGQRTILVALPDCQRVFLQIGGPDAGRRLGRPFLELPLDDGRLLAAYPADAATIDAFCRAFEPRNAPRALGTTPRIGIGCRMSTRLWPGAFSAMASRGFAANTIQNSVRELNLLDDLREGRPPDRNYASGFGMIESGYTGSTFEGLWVAGVLAALEHDAPLVYGADADHVQTKRADEGLRRALRVLDAARYYTFFTLDVADVLSYDAMASASRSEELLGRLLPHERERREALVWHRDPLTIDGRTYRLPPDIVARCLAKYGEALDAAATLCARIAELRPGVPVDVEFAFDEHPPEVRGPDCISTDEEVLFVAREIARRGLPITHLAPNVGVEKGFDYRLADGLAALERRVEAHHRIAEGLGFLLDIHSADDLSAPTRRAIGRATKGRVHYKISPMLQLMLAETVQECQPQLFRRWWDDAVAYAEAEAAGGSAFAADCLAAHRASPDPSPSTKHEVFRHFFFAFPGRRDAAGRFVNREAFYALPRECSSAYQQRVHEHLCSLADDLFAGRDHATVHRQL